MATEAVESALELVSEDLATLREVVRTSESSDSDSERASQAAAIYLVANRHLIDLAVDAWANTPESELREIEEKTRELDFSATSHSFLSIATRSLIDAHEILVSPELAGLFQITDDALNMLDRVVRFGKHLIDTRALPVAWHPVRQLLELPELPLAEAREEALAVAPSPLWVGGISTTWSSEAPAVESSEFSTAALRALTYASNMLSGIEVNVSRLRTAALLGALYESATTNVLPTTGEVVRLVQERQGKKSSPEQPFIAAAAAAGLTAPSAALATALTREALETSNVAPLVRDAIEMQRRSGAATVHLRHILATGVDPAVSPAALNELGVTLDELRERWRASIADTWPEESQDGWDLILRGVQPAAGAPPTARVHTDRWTVEDRLDYALYAKAIAEFIRHPNARPPMVISVQGPWGQGKTSLMRMIQRDLDPGHPDLSEAQGGDVSSAMPDQPSELTFEELRDSLDGRVPMPQTKPSDFRTVWFNAWKYQSSEQIWAGLAHAILAQLPARLSPRQRELFWLQLQIRRINPAAVRDDIHKAVLERFIPRLLGWVALLLGTGLVAGLGLLVGGLKSIGGVVSAGGVVAAIAGARVAWARATREALSRHLEGAYLRYVRQPDYEGKLGYLHLVEEDMTRALDLLTPERRPAVIFIDDLDRCSPAKIGEVIEAVNLFLAGEYPNCAFVIGIDAEVIAASMEVLHSQIIDKLDGRRGELGWRFMDKFVQLPFVIPRLHPDQRATYLRGLFDTPSGTEAQDILAEADKLQSEVREQRQPVDELARRVGDLAPRLAAVAPELARSLGEDVVAAGARAFSDHDPEVIQALADQLRYLSDNPRTIKRAVNLYRFHRFAAFARQASTLPLEAATPEQIGRWIVAIIRWPDFVRWLQTRRDPIRSSENGSEASEERDPAASVIALAETAKVSAAFTQQLENQGIHGAWTHDEELWEFLREETRPELKLTLAGRRGLW